MEKGYNVTITFESFHTEREFDVLEIFDGNTETTPTMPLAVESSERWKIGFVADQVRRLETSFVLFTISLRSDSQQPHSGDPERRPAYTLQPHKLRSSVPGALVLRPRHK